MSKEDSIVHFTLRRAEYSISKEKMIIDVSFIEMTWDKSILELYKFIDKLNVKEQVFTIKHDSNKINVYNLHSKKRGIDD